MLIMKRGCCLLNRRFDTKPACTNSSCMSLHTYTPSTTDALRKPICSLSFTSFTIIYARFSSEKCWNKLASDIRVLNKNNARDGWVGVAHLQEMYQGKLRSHSRSSSDSAKAMR